MCRGEGRRLARESALTKIMMKSTSTSSAASQRLESVLRGMNQVAVAVSGGVDSLTLGVFAHRLLGDRSVMFHAVSPAVPPEATRRTGELAEREGWELKVLDAGEFESSDYMRNPVNRCFYCKASLYGSIHRQTSAQIVSGTNLDDLGEYRPGLMAAKDHGVRHPFVEAEIDKNGVRALARELQLGDLAELPASPCLSSRVETGIGIDPTMLGCIHDIEQMLVAELAPRTVRCRVRASGLVVELDETTLAALGAGQRVVLAARIRDRFLREGFERSVDFAPYRLGSAFLHLSLEPDVRGLHADAGCHPGMRR